MSIAPLSPLDDALDTARPLRVALVGAGAMGKRHARVLAGRPERFELVGVTDVDARAASELAEAHGARVIAREADALTSADALVVATPIGAHAATVQRALVARRHVLVEKPIAATSREATQLVALAQATGARLFVGHSERFNPVVRALARLVDPASVVALEHRRVGARLHPRAPQAPGAGAEGALVNLGVHDLDVAAYLTRSPLAPLAATGDLGADGVEERARVLARTESGVDVEIVVDQRPADPQRRRTLVLRTKTHTWRGDLLVPSLVRTCLHTGAVEAIPLDTEEPLVAQAFAFLAAVRSAGAHEIATGRDGLRALLAAERARRALGLGPGGKTWR